MDIDPAGQVGGKVKLTRREIGGPGVRPPQRTGFGGRLLDLALVAQGGEIQRRFERDGLICELTMPTS